MTSKEGGKPAPYHYGMKFYDTLHDLIQVKSNCYLTGQIRLYMDTLEEMVGLTCWKWSEKEESAIRKKFTKVNKLFVSLRHSSGLVEESFAQKIKGELKSLEISIMRKLDKYSMIFPPSQVTGMAKLQRRYDLDD